MIGALLTLLFCLGTVGLGQRMFWFLLKDQDPALAFAMGGLIGLGVIGTATLFIGLIPGGLGWGLYLVAALALVGLIGLKGRLAAPKKPESAEWLPLLGIGLAALFALVSVLAPSDINDWDTLAYHLAAPKFWIEAGQIVHIPFIHHSNFPFTVDNLYIWGLQWGGQSGAKAFMLSYLILGAVAVFGFARERYGRWPGWWAAFIFVTVPVVLWESGTAYIDVAHGLYAGLGILLAARYLHSAAKADLWLCALCLGFAMGSKYTGLQTFGGVGLALLAFSIPKSSKSLGSIALAGLLALVIAAPWYVKNALWNGNPVYPFFYEVLGGQNWSAEHAAVYKDEQQTFGVGRLEQGRDLLAVGHAVLGLAYQPGRYVNPGQTQGMGNPLGAIGVPVLGAMLLWLFSGRSRRFEGVVLAVVVLSLGMWFILSQQSRYIVTLAVPLAVLGGGAVVRLPAGRALASVAVGHAIYTLWLFHTMLVGTQLQIVAGKIDRDAYLSQTTPFSEMAKGIDAEVGEDGKVALYDEVFGYFLNVPYFWANPGHSTVIPYSSLNDGKQFAAKLRELGFTHVYVSMSPVVRDRAFADRWVAAMGLTGPVQPLEDQEALMEGFQTRWLVLLADAVAQSELTIVGQERAGILFRL